MSLDYFLELERQMKKYQLIRNKTRQNKIPNIPEEYRGEWIYYDSPDEPKNNSNREYCYWCGEKTIDKVLFTSSYKYCEKCGK